MLSGRSCCKDDALGEALVLSFGLDIENLHQVSPDVFLLHILLDHHQRMGLWMVIEALVAEVLVACEAIVSDPHDGEGVASFAAFAFVHCLGFELPLARLLNGRWLLLQQLLQLLQDQLLRLLRRTFLCNYIPWRR